MDKKLISIIIPSYNQGRFLGDTIESIVSQNCPEVEIIIMDGGSKDESVEVIKKYEPHIAYWQSEKDNGQSDAINRGFKKATGEFVTWLNSDDVLLPGSLRRVIDTINRYPDYNFFMGNVVWMDKNGKIIKANKVEADNRFWNSRHLFGNGGPSAFMRKSVLERIGYLREDFYYMMDTELWHRLISTGNYFKRLPFYVWGLRLHEDAKMSGHNFKDSPLADPNHPSWQKKRREGRILNEKYPVSPLLSRIWRLTKLFGPASITRLTDRKYLGKDFREI